MNHKRKRPKHQRGGCLICKPWKDERTPHSGLFVRANERKLVEPEDDITWAEAAREVEREATE